MHSWIKLKHLNNQWRCGRNKSSPMTVQNYTNEYLEIIIRRLYVISGTQAVIVIKGTIIILHCSAWEQSCGDDCTYTRHEYVQYRHLAAKIKGPPQCGHIRAVISVALGRINWPLLCSLKDKYMWHILMASAALTWAKWLYCIHSLLLGVPFTFTP